MELAPTGFAVERLDPNSQSSLKSEQNLSNTRLIHRNRMLIASRFGNRIEGSNGTYHDRIRGQDHVSNLFDTLHGFKLAKLGGIGIDGPFPFLNA